MQSMIILPTTIKPVKHVSKTKLNYSMKLKSLLTQYNTFLIISINNVRGNVINKIRKDFSGKAVFLFGRNTLIRRIIRDYIKETGKRQLSNSLHSIKGHCGFVFTTPDYIEPLKNEFENRTIPTRIKGGSICPIDVYIPAGPTFLEPTKTAGFSCMNIATRIRRGQIDIMSDVHVFMKGQKVYHWQAYFLDK
eukprot:328262_1